LIFKTDELLTELRRCIVKSAGQSGALECFGNLLHFAHIAPRFWHRDHRCAIAFLCKCRLGDRPLLQQRRIHAFTIGVGSNSNRQNVTAFRPCRISELQSRCGAGLITYRTGIEEGAAEEFGDSLRSDARQVEPCGARLFNRRADDSAVNEAGPGLAHDPADFLGGGARDSVGVDINSVEFGFRNFAGDAQSRMGRADREHDFAFG
jgi:hypothetical protein